MDIREEWTWQRARKYLPFDLTEIAMGTGLLRRCRAFADAEALTRMLLLCAAPGATFERAAAWGCDSGLFEGTGPALFWRMRHATAFLERVFDVALGAACLGCPAEGRYKGWEMVAVDATTLCGPGAKGTDKRLHTEYLLGSHLALRVELTGPEGGETFKRHPDLSERHLVLADCGYGHGPGLLALLGQRCKMLVRFDLRSIRLLNKHGEKLTYEQGEALVPAKGAVEIAVRLPGWEAPLRAIGERSPRGGTAWYVTNLTRKELPTKKARALYSKRWQVELFFKRMKSLLDLGDLPTRDGPTSEPWIWAKLILCLLATLMAHESFSPWEQETDQSFGMEALRPGSVASDRRDSRKRRSRATANPAPQA